MSSLTDRGLVDYEEETPGLTGYYRNITSYPHIYQEWTDKSLHDERAKLQDHLENQPRNANNSLRIEWMERARTLLAEEYTIRQNASPDCYVCGFSGHRSEDYGANRLRNAEFAKGTKRIYFHDQCWLEWNTLYKGTPLE